VLPSNGPQKKTQSPNLHDSRVSAAIPLANFVRSLQIKRFTRANLCINQFLKLVYMRLVIRLPREVENFYYQICARINPRRFGYYMADGRSMDPYRYKRRSNSFDRRAIDDVFSRVPPHKDLPFFTALRVVKVARGCQIALQIAPWRFGWTLFLTYVPFVISSFILFLKNGPYATLLLFIVLWGLGILLLNIFYLTTTLAVTARRIAICDFYLNKSMKNIARAKTRISR